MTRAARCAMATVRTVLGSFSSEGPPREPSPSCTAARSGVEKNRSLARVTSAMHPQ